MKKIVLVSTYPQRFLLEILVYIVILQGRAMVSDLMVSRERVTTMSYAVEEDRRLP